MYVSKEIKRMQFSDLQIYAEKNVLRQQRWFWFWLVICVSVLSMFRTKICLNQWTDSFKRKVSLPSVRTAQSHEMAGEREDSRWRSKNVALTFKEKGYNFGLHKTTLSHFTLLKGRKCFTPKFWMVCVRLQTRFRCKSGKFVRLLCLTVKAALEATKRGIGLKLMPIGDLMRCSHL